MPPDGQTSHTGCVRFSFDLANGRPLTSASSTLLIDPASNPAHRYGQFLSPSHEETGPPVPSWVSAPGSDRRGTTDCCLGWIVAVSRPSRACGQVPVRADGHPRSV